MYIDGKVFPLKTVRGRNTGKFVGRYRDVSTLEFPSMETRIAMETLKCTHGWTLDYLLELEQEKQFQVSQWEHATDHPFFAAGITGARKGLANVRAHIQECYVNQTAAV
jgi:hypothetical protein